MSDAQWDQFIAIYGLVCCVVAIFVQFLGPKE
jgi:hypothetical protein